jgi:hypothetical protein
MSIIFTRLRTAKTLCKGPLAAPRVSFSTVLNILEGFKRQGRSREEAYFRKITDKQQLQAKELKALHSILGEKHGLTEGQILKLQEWKKEVPSLK